MCACTRTIFSEFLGFFVLSVYSTQRTATTALGKILLINTLQKEIPGCCRLCSCTLILHYHYAAAAAISQLPLLSTSAHVPTDTVHGHRRPTCTFRRLSAFLWPTTIPATTGAAQSKSTRTGALQLRCCSVRREPKRTPSKPTIAALSQVHHTRTTACSCTTTTPRSGSTKIRDEKDDVGL